MHGQKQSVQARRSLGNKQQHKYTDKFYHFITAISANSNAFYHLYRIKCWLPPLAVLIIYAPFCIQNDLHLHICSVYLGSPLDISDADGHELLSPNERNLCSILRLLPRLYLSIKETLIAANAKFGHLKRAQARSLIKIDVNKTSRIYDFFVGAGWINPRPVVPSSKEHTSEPTEYGCQDDPEDPKFPTVKLKLSISK